VSAHRYQSSFNGIIFNRQLRVDGATLYEQLYAPDDERRLDPTYAQSDYRLESFDLTRVTVEDFREMKQFLEGAEANESYEGVLFGLGRGVIHGSSPADLEDKYWAMRAAFSPALIRIAAAALDPKSVLPFDFKVDTATAPGYSARRLYCRPAIGRPVIIGRMREGLSRRFMIQLISFDPKVYSQIQHQTAIELAGEDLTNAGNFYTYPQIQILFSAAGAANLTITNSTTGTAFVLDASTASAGQIWVLDPKTSRLYKVDDNANRFTQRVSGYLSQLWLPPGDSTWAITNTAGILSATFFWRDAWA